MDKPHIFDIWNERGIQKHLNRGEFHLEDLIPGMLPADPDRLYEQASWDAKQRQTVQIMKSTGRHGRGEVILPGLFREMESWQYPLSD